MEILLFLFVAIMVGTLVFYVTTEPAPSNIEVMEFHPYPAVKIQPCKDACQAATQTSQVIFLSTQSPKLPLKACDCFVDCDCQFRHFTDRRQKGERRDGYHMMHNVTQNKERRAAKLVGRRVSDQ